MIKEFNELIIKDVNKSFGNLTVLDNFNLVVKKGEFVTLLGPSGCGKSTALNCIAGLLRVSGGSIFAGNECLDDSNKIFVPPEKRGFGIVFQNYALFPHLNVYKNVAFGLELRKLPKQQIKEKVEEALRLVHLEDQSEKYPSQLSGGQQQRVAIARCTVTEPKLLLLDEPLSNLDAKLRVEMRYELKSIHERLNISSIYVTHDQYEALALSDRIVVMKLGEIQQIGTPEEIYSNPSNRFVADFMGFKNMWPAIIKEINELGEMLEYVIDVCGTELKCHKNTSDIVNDELKKAFKNNEQVVTAIRPENIKPGEADVNNITCRVKIVEYQGTSNHVTAIFSDKLMVNAQHSFNVKEYEIAKYNIPPESILIFPGEEVKRI